MFDDFDCEIQCEELNEADFYEDDDYGFDEEALRREIEQRTWERGRLMRLW